VVVRKDLTGVDDYVEVPSSEEVTETQEKFNLAFLSIYRNQDPFKGKTLVQKHGGRYVIQFPPPKPADEAELDGYYELPFARAGHPMYDRAGGIPGFQTVKFSVISHRGCCGECSFCSLSMHQGRIIQSRSRQSIVAEVKAMAERPDFKGTVTDIGGPTVNLYKTHCARWSQKGTCDNRHCLTPLKCPSLKLGQKDMLRLYREVLSIPGVKHLFLESGFRYDLLADEKAAEYLEQVCSHHVSGRMKVAPEHCVDKVLQVMNKPSIKVYEKFEGAYREANMKAGKKQFLVNYFISGHPGSTLEDSLALALYLIRKGIHPEQIQDFLPLPLTLAGAIYYTGKDPVTGKPVHVTKAFQERKMQRALIQYRNPKSMPLVREALALMGKGDLLPLFIKAAGVGKKRQAP
jgi:uncharacterized radical SAM protein YgiQ